jgi:MFS family permease
VKPKWWTLIAVSVATFMLLLDITVVNVALPSIRDDLDASFTDLQWVLDAYALTLAALVLTAGSLADRFGRRVLRQPSAGQGPAPGSRGLRDRAALGALLWPTVMRTHRGYEE